MPFSIISCLYGSSNWDLACSCLNLQLKTSVMFHDVLICLIWLVESTARHIFVQCAVCYIWLWLHVCSLCFLLFLFVYQFYLCHAWMHLCTFGTTFIFKYPKFEHCTLNPEASSYILDCVPWVRIIQKFELFGTILTNTVTCFICSLIMIVLNIWGCCCIIILDGWISASAMQHGYYGCF